MRPKHELIKTQIYQSRDGATAAIAYYTETFYNCSRRHSHAGAFSPEQVAATHKSRTQGPLNPSISTGADGMRRREQANAHRVDWCVSFPVKLTVEKETVRLMKASGET